MFLWRTTSALLEHFIIYLVNQANTSTNRVKKKLILTNLFYSLILDSEMNIFKLLYCDKIVITFKSISKNGSTINFDIIVYGRKLDLDSTSWGI